MLEVYNIEKMTKEAEELVEEMSRPDVFSHDSTEELEELLAVADLFNVSMVSIRARLNQELQLRRSQEDD